MSGNRVMSLSRQVLRVAIPAIGEAYLQNLVGIVDMFFISSLGLVAIDAVGVANIFVLTYTGVFGALSAAASIYMARGHGAGDDNQVWYGFTHGLWLSTLAGFMIGAWSIGFRLPLLHLMGATGELLQTTIFYFSAMMAAAPLLAWFAALGAAFRCLGDTKTPFRIGVEMNGIHVALDYLLIFGIGSWHGLGIEGAALATILARAYGVVRLGWRLHGLDALRRAQAAWAFHWKLWWGTIRLAVPAAGERLFMRMGQVIYFGLIVRMGVGAYGAHNIAGSFTTFASTIGGGFAVTATALMGQAIGSGNLRLTRTLRKTCYVLAASSMTLVTLLVFTISPWLGHVFTQDRHVLHLLTVILGIDVVSQPFLAAVLVDTAAIQVGGNTLYPMIVTAAGMWGVRTLGVYVFGVLAGFGLPAVWVSIAADNLFRSVLFALYRRKPSWVKPLQTSIH